MCQQDEERRRSAGIIISLCCRRTGKRDILTLYVLFTYIRFQAIVTDNSRVNYVSINYVVVETFFAESARRRHLFLLSFENPDYFQIFAVCILAMGNLPGNFFFAFFSFFNKIQDGHQNPMAHARA